jgi:Rps23 Pro-64 3,4-dihydroxylase Tpa1-like proline 4-hydroxylase
MNENNINENIINNINNIEILKIEFSNKKKLKISNFLNNNFSEILFKHILLEKNWTLSTGIDKNKYEKSTIKQNEKINSLQIKNVNNAFSKNQFSYIFYRSMNNINMSYIEFTLRKYLNSIEFINKLNEITNLGLTHLTTMFLSKYSSGSFLSPHSDKGNGRLAFVINLTKFWKPQYGGNLHFLNDDRTEIIDTFVPEFNNLIFFHVPEENGIPHYVSHVGSNVKLSRYAITGWFN